MHKIEGKMWTLNINLILYKLFLNVKKFSITFYIDIKK